jgi:glutamyl-tRNA synthetase
MTVAALREFVLKQGPSRAMVFMDWTNFWSINKRMVDPIAPRHTAVAAKDAVKATIIGGPPTAYSEDKLKHPKNPEIGTRKVAYSSHIILDQDDVKLFAQDEEITLMAWGNAIVRKIVGSNPIVSSATLFSE